MNLKNYALNFFLVVALSLVITGCNATEDIADDSSKEAEVERGLMALDNENYESAEEIFEKLKNKYSTDNSLKTYYSNALAGLAGLNTFRLMETIDNLNDQNSDDSIEIVGRTLTGTEQGSDPELTTDQIADKTKRFEKAISSILEIAGKDYDPLTKTKTPATRKIQATSITDLDLSQFTDDELVQLGLIALNHAILVISDLVKEDSTDKIIFNKEQFQGLYDFHEIESALSKLSIDIKLINNAVDAIDNFMNLNAGESNDISEEFQEFTSEIDNGYVDSSYDEQEANNGEITKGELEHYLENL